nr:Na+/H+ antiporter subunit E [Acidovorax temperans]
MKRIVHALLPTPVLSIALLVLWLLLNRSMSAGHI